MTAETFAKLPAGTHVIYYRPKSVDHLDQGVVCDPDLSVMSRYIAWDDGTVNIPTKSLRYVRKVDLE